MNFHLPFEKEDFVASAMTDYGTPPAVFREERRAARKEYVCCECGGRIEPGEVYGYTRGCWPDGALPGESYWKTFRSCKNCADIREHWNARSTPHDSDPPYGGLFDHLRYYGD